MASLHTLHREQGQSPWLDNLRRGWLTSGELQQWIDRGVRGVTSNPTIFAKAMMQTDDYDSDLARLVGEGYSTEQAYWSLVVDDLVNALDLLSPVYNSSAGDDGYVSVEVDPGLANERKQTLEAGLELARRIDRRNLLIKVPATNAGLGAISDLLANSVSVNVTLIFGLKRYAEVMEAYIAGLENNPESDLGAVRSVASFFVSRLDAQIDKQLANIGSAEALSLQGKAAVALSKLAYEMFTETFSGERWADLEAKGACVQRPLWASTSTKNPEFSDTLYVDSLIGPQTINTLPDATIDAFIDHGTVSRTIDIDVDEARCVVDRLAGLGIDCESVATTLELQGVTAFQGSFDEVLTSLEARASALGD